MKIAPGENIKTGGDDRRGWFKSDPPPRYKEKHMGVVSGSHLAIISNILSI